MARSSFFLDGIDAHAYKLPHPPLGLPIVLIVRKALARAFEILRSRDGTFLGGAKEDEITIALRAVLENELRRSGEIPGFNRETFDKVDRQHRAANYDGESLDKEPDMMFSIRDDSRRNVLSTEDGLIVECKPVDADHTPGQHYCDRGVYRFVNGNYAWAMQEALMLAYVRDGRTIERNLLPVMEKSDSRTKLKTQELPAAIAIGDDLDNSTEQLHSSVHSRGFPWRENKGSATPITVYHSWHCCNQ